ncbi:hypothetical protein F4823DRAFT_623961 [Ustulina deusta]|nr:hypothetical protein F4823DRAFT_623961 [Ustulina deusta]
MEVESEHLERKSQTPASDKNESIHYHRSEPGPAMGGSFYREDEQRPSMVFKFCPDPSKPYRVMDHDWLAGLEVKCPDVPRLMREGFHWDADNVVREEGYLEINEEEPTEAGGPRQAGVRRIEGTRWYFLKDLHQPPRWIASLAVRAVDVRILYNFDLCQLSRELIRSVWASNQFQQAIYGYESYRPTVRFNMIYDKMPMEGWWPWPRKEIKAQIEDDVFVDVNEKAVPGNCTSLI